MASSGIVLAKFGHLDGGPVGRLGAVVGPDGRTLYAAGAGGILAVGTEDLAVSGAFLAEKDVNALGVSADGSTLYALLSSGTIVALDADTGETLGEVPGSDYDRLLAVVPF